MLSLGPMAQWAMTCQCLEVVQLLGRALEWCSSLSIDLNGLWKGLGSFCVTGQMVALLELE